MERITHIRLSQHITVRTTYFARQIVKELKKDMSRQRKLYCDRMNMLKNIILSRPGKLCRDEIHEGAQGTGRDKRLHVATETCDED